MSKSTNRFVENWKQKNLFGKITDVLIILFIIALFIPQSRMVVGGFVNRIMAKVVTPSQLPEDKRETLSVQDYNWKLRDMSGNTVNLSDYKEQVLFINLWATWCPPCVGEMPEIQSLWEEFQDNPQVKMLLISNETPVTVENFLDKRNYTFPVYTTMQAAPEVFKSTGIPVTFIISKNGEMMVRKTGAANWGGKKTVNLMNKLAAD